MTSLIDIRCLTTEYLYTNKVLEIPLNIVNFRLFQFLPKQKKSIMKNLSIASLFAVFVIAAGFTFQPKPWVAPDKVAKTANPQKMMPLLFLQVRHCGEHIVHHAMVKPVWVMVLKQPS